MDHADATRIIDVIDARIKKSLASMAHVETTWGSVAAIDSSGRYADLYLYGEAAPYASEYFRLPNGLTVNVGDSVRAAIDKERGERWVAETHSFSTYNKLAFNIINGEITFGSGSALPDVKLYRSGVDILKTDDSLWAVGRLNTSSIASAWVPSHIFDNAASSSQLAIELRIAGTRRGSIRADSSGDVVLSGQGGGGTYLAWDEGTGGVHFGNGAANEVASVNSGGDALFRDASVVLFTVRKNGTTSTIAFPAQSNDPGYIKHIESSNTAEMRFSVSDDVGSVDAFTFGSDPAGSFSERVRIRTDGTIEFSGGATERDTTLYRGAANQLNTDDAFYAGGPWVQTAGDFYTVNGNIYFGGGAWDTVLYRPGANRLRTEDDFEVVGLLRPNVDRWHTSLDGKGRVYYANNARSYFGSADGYEWRNAVDASIAVLKNGGSWAKGGSAFPASPATNDIYYRTDLGLEFYWDGARWVSVQLFTLNLADRVGSLELLGISATTAAATRVAVPHAQGGSDLWLVNHVISFFINAGTALSGSHSWVGVVEKHDTNAGRTTLITLTINSGALSVFRRTETAIGAALGGTATYFKLGSSWTKTGTPGPLSWSEHVTYRIVAT